MKKTLENSVVPPNFQRFISPKRAHDGIIFFLYFCSPTYSLSIYKKLAKVIISNSHQWLSLIALSCLKRMNGFINRATRRVPRWWIREWLRWWKARGNLDRNSESPDADRMWAPLPHLTKEPSHGCLGRLCGYFFPLANIPFFPMVFKSRCPFQPILSFYWIDLYCFVSSNLPGYAGNVCEFDVKPKKQTI